jgi:formylglycine-generating enzyme required for sulfatase activity
MSGNVYEIVDECNKGECVILGGSWSDRANEIQATPYWQFSWDTAQSDNKVGFRLARTLP